MAKYFLIIMFSLLLIKKSINEILQNIINERECIRFLQHKKIPFATQFFEKKNHDP